MNKKSLYEERPDLMEEWDFKKNDIQPTQITVVSHKKVWWNCSKGHSFQQEVEKRTTRSKDALFVLVD